MTNDPLRAALEALREAHPHVCSLCCPSVFKSGDEPRHCELCKRIAAILAAHPEPPAPDAQVLLVNPDTGVGCGNCTALDAAQLAACREVFSVDLPRTPDAASCACCGATTAEQAFALIEPAPDAAPAGDGPLERLCPSCEGGEEDCTCDDDESPESRIEGYKVALAEGNRYYAALTADLARLQADNARLRDALLNVEQSAVNWMSINGNMALEYIRDAARAALAGEAQDAE